MGDARIRVRGGARRSRDRTRTVRSTSGLEGELFASHNKGAPVSGKHSISSTNSEVPLSNKMEVPGGGPCPELGQLSVDLRESESGMSGGFVYPAGRLSGWTKSSVRWYDIDRSKNCVRLVNRGLSNR